MTEFIVIFLESFVTSPKRVFGALVGGSLGALGSYLQTGQIDYVLVFVATCAGVVINSVIFSYFQKH